jgi:hypothetical protein
MSIRQAERLRERTTSQAQSFFFTILMHDGDLFFHPDFKNFKWDHIVLGLTSPETLDRDFTSSGGYHSQRRLISHRPWI